MSIPNDPLDPHPMRPGCAKEFGKIEASLGEHNRFRQEVRQEFSEIKEKLEGIAEIKDMLAQTKIDDAVEVGRIIALEKAAASAKVAHEKLEKRVWSERLKIGGFIAFFLGVLEAIQFFFSRGG